MAACGSTHIHSLAGCLPAPQERFILSAGLSSFFTFPVAKARALENKSPTAPPHGSWPSNSLLLTTHIAVRPVDFYLLTAAVGLADITVEFKDWFRAGISCAHLTGPVPRFQSCCTDSSALTALLDSHFQWTSRAQHLPKEGVKIKSSLSVEDTKNYTCASCMRPKLSAPSENTAWIRIWISIWIQKIHLESTGGWSERLSYRLLPTLLNQQSPCHCTRPISTDGCFYSLCRHCVIQSLETGATNHALVRDTTSSRFSTAELKATQHQTWWD